MFLLLTAQTIIVIPMYFQGSKIMGDNIQGICMIALTLEFLRYLKDRELSPSRCVIVASCIYVSIMSTFVSVFALRQLYLMAYQFNTVVYKQYQNEFGRVKWKPFVLGIKNFFEALSGNIEQILTALTVAILVMWAAREKEGERFIPALCLFLCVTGNMTRESTGFHSLPAWNLCITLIFLLGGELFSTVRLKKAEMALGIVTVLYCIQPYIALVGDHIVYVQPVVDGTDREVVELTEPGEGIFIDTYIHDSIYLLYKERYPINRNCSILPWYMDWFEQDTLEDLYRYSPRIAVYDMATHTDKTGDFCPALTQAIQTRYTRESEDSFVWRLK